MMHHFKMSNKHVFCKLICIDVKEYEIIEVENKNRMKANDILKQSFTKQKVN